MGLFCKVSSELGFCTVKYDGENTAENIFFAMYLHFHKWQMTNGGGADMANTIPTLFYVVKQHMLGWVSVLSEIQAFKQILTNSKCNLITLGRRNKDIS